jgi:hypothetical protein
VTIKVDHTIEAVAPVDLGTRTVVDEPVECLVATTGIVHDREDVHSAL